MPAARPAHTARDQGLRGAARTRARVTGGPVCLSAMCCSGSGASKATHRLSDRQQSVPPAASSACSVRSAECQQDL